VVSRLVVGLVGHQAAPGHRQVVAVHSAGSLVEGPAWVQWEDERAAEVVGLGRRGWTKATIGLDEVLFGLCRSAPATDPWGQHSILHFQTNYQMKSTVSWAHSQGEFFDSEGIPGKFIGLTVDLIPKRSRYQRKAAQQTFGVRLHSTNPCVQKSIQIGKETHKVLICCK
jgi:hypothetical protein